LRELIGFGSRERSYLVQVGSDREEAAIAADDERMRISRELNNRVGESENAGSREAICFINRNDAEKVCVARLFDFEKFVSP